MYNRQAISITMQELKRNTTGASIYMDQVIWNVFCLANVSGASIYMDQKSLQIRDVPIYFKRFGSFHLVTN